MPLHHCESGIRRQSYPSASGTETVPPDPYPPTPRSRISCFLTGFVPPSPLWPCHIPCRRPPHDSQIQCPFLPPFLFCRADSALLKCRSGRTPGFGRECRFPSLLRTVCRLRLSVPYSMRRHLKSQYIFSSLPFQIPCYTSPIFHVKMNQDSFYKSLNHFRNER